MRRNPRLSRQQRGSELLQRQSTLDGTRSNPTSTDIHRRYRNCAPWNWCRTRTAWCSLILVSLVLVLLQHTQFSTLLLPDVPHFLDFEATAPHPATQQSLPASMTDSDATTERGARPRQDRGALEALAPWSNVTTLANWEDWFSGFRNQMMAFTLLVLHAQLGAHGSQRHGQLLLDSLRLKDFLGSEQNIPFATLWDVPHWNSHYPRLPRLVQYDPHLHEHGRRTQHP